MEEKIPTAEEFLIQNGCQKGEEDFFSNVESGDLIKFAKLHVKAALEEAYFAASESDLNVGQLNKVLNAYPEDLII